MVSHDKLVFLRLSLVVGCSANLALKASLSGCEDTSDELKTYCTRSGER